MKFELESWQRKNPAVVSYVRTKWELRRTTAELEEEIENVWAESYFNSPPGGDDLPSGNFLKTWREIIDNVALLKRLASEFKQDFEKKFESKARYQAHQFALQSKEFNK